MILFVTWFVGLSEVCRPFGQNIPEQWYSTYLLHCPPFPWLHLSNWNLFPPFPAVVDLKYNRRFDVKAFVKSVGKYDLKEHTLSPLKRGGMSVCSFLEKVGFLK